MKLDPKIEKILDKALAGEQITRQEAVKLLQVDENSPELYAIHTCSVYQIVHLKPFNTWELAHNQVKYNFSLEPATA